MNNPSNRRFSDRPACEATSAGTDQGLQGAVAEMFDPQGPLATGIDGFHARDGQVRLALAVARVLEQGGLLVAEAATGVGKTFAYLVPALLAGERALLSTATKALQDQLYGRDLPLLARLLGLPVRTALLKGRSSYLCLHRLEQAVQQGAALPAAQRHTLTGIERWARSTRSGDLAELPELDEHSPLIPLVTSTRENCLGADCPQFRPCHVNLARREAMAADVVVINHHLYFADLSIRESGMAELLPTVRVVVFDEAHQLNETGIRFLGRQLGTGQLLDLARDLLAAGQRHARGLGDWPALASDLEAAARGLRLVAGPVRGSRRLRWSNLVPEGLDEAQWQGQLAGVDAVLRRVGGALDPVRELAPDLVRLRQRAAGLLERVAQFAQPCVPARVRWVDVGTALRLHESPLDVAEAMRAQLAAPERESEPEPPGPGRAWVFVSATLGDDERLSWFTAPCGLQDAEVLRIGSPFDYTRQAALYVPRHMVHPADASHSAQVAALAAEAAARLGGRTLVLTTTLRALRAIGQALGEQLGADGRIELIQQGQLPKRVLMQRFRAAGQGGRPGCVLVGSASFWEGVDMPGDALQLVIIDKLPFPPPGDPLVEARCRRVEAEGGSAFSGYSVPEAAVALKQGAGRLIRSETDRGILVICDTRLLAMGYGRRLLAALPPMRRLETAEEFDAALGELVRGGTPPASASGADPMRSNTPAALAGRA